jgi:signal transduction histidine kinase
MVNQAAGEFKERFAARKLNLVSTVPEEAIIIHVDGKRMWRIIENIYNNAVKYTMPGTRIYQDIKQSKDKKSVIYSLKNVSEQPLNITAEELTERFIRGDVSRSTEGSGLGLSIAKSLTELHDGEFKLEIDGDLFKVTIIIPSK